LPESQWRLRKKINICCIQQRYQNYLMDKIFF
jgi:hypothetical protein